MTRSSILSGFAAASTLLMASTASAQWAPGSELVGQTVQVTTNGSTNAITFEPGGTARIATPGGKVVPASWTANQGQLCLRVGAAQECYPYSQPFQAGQPVTATSSCGSSSNWLASATNPVGQPQPQRSGERG